MGLILDTNFIIGAERDAKSGVTANIDSFFEPRAAETFYITFTIAGELACGKSASPKHDWDRLCRPYPIIPWSKDVSWQYGELYRALAGKGQLIGANDLWIAATALVHGMGVVTNNSQDFGRVEGLIVVPFPHS